MTNGLLGAALGISICLISLIVTNSEADPWFDLTGEWPCQRIKSNNRGSIQVVGDFKNKEMLPSTYKEPPGQ